MDFNTWKEFYGWGFCTISQLQQAVKQNMLTDLQYKDITGKDYPVIETKVPIQVKTPIETKPITIEPEAKQSSTSKEDSSKKEVIAPEHVIAPESKPESFLQKILNV